MTDEQPVSREYWDAITAGIVAAHHGDHRGHVDAILKLESLRPSPGRATAYVYLLLQLVLVEIGADELATDDSARSWLLNYAREVYPTWAPLIGRPALALERLFLTPFGFAPQGEAIVGAEMIFLGTAALGVILDNPTVDLGYLIPRVDSWWEQNRASVQPSD